MRAIPTVLIPDGRMIGMPMVDNIKEFLNSKEVHNLFEKLYGSNEAVIQDQIGRYCGLVDKFVKQFPSSNGELRLFSTSGRTEIGGNHTDHNAGRVLAAAVNLDSIAVAAKTDDDVITVCSEGYYKPFIVNLSKLDPVEKEKGTTTALIRGIARRFKDLGFHIGGFNAYITSNVLRGSGLSSSASIEVLLATIMSHLYNSGTVSPEQLAMIGQYAENEFFGKPCGLMDQMACAVGGFTAIDFKDPKNPLVKKIDFDFGIWDYCLLVVNTGGSHADLTEDYAAVPREMKAVAKALGGQVCRELSMAELIRNIPSIRKEVGDRAILRAMHFLVDDQRVVEQVEALQRGDFKAFLSLINESGNSSWKWLQNCFTTKNPREQGVTLALALTEHFLKQKGSGACRVHGGGFAGTIQVFIPNSEREEYIEMIEGIFGEKAATVLSIRPYGTICLDSTVK